jgi:uncharacterized protein YbaR (Trm112 family)
MHLLLTDVLVCPRCGPGFPLIMLAERLEERRLYEGRLGCANCRELYAVRGGFADLRYPPGAPLAAGDAAEVEPADAEAAIRLGALLGVAEGAGTFIVVGPGARLATAIPSIVPDLEVVAVDAALAGLPEQPGVSRVASGERLPFANGAARGLAVTAGATVALEEALRVVAPSGRLVLEAATPDDAERLRAAGCEILLEEGAVVVASPKRLQ